MKKASPSSTQPKFTAHIQTKNLLEKRSHRFATRSLSRFLIGAVLRIQRQTAAIGVFLCLFRFSVLAFEVGEGHVQRLVPEAEVQQNTCKGSLLRVGLVSFRGTGEEP